MDMEKACEIIKVEEELSEKDSLEHKKGKEDEKNMASTCRISTWHQPAQGRLLVVY